MQRIKCLIAVYAESGDGEIITNVACRACSERFAAITGTFEDTNELECPKCGAFDTEPGDVMVAEIT